MLLSLSKVFRNIGVVFESKNYALLALASALVFGVLLYYLTVYNVAYKSLAIFIEMNGLMFTYLSIASIMLIAILFSINTALLAFAIKMKAFKKSQGIAGIGGVIVGGIASGCPTCGSVILAVLAGSPLGLFYLPYWGLELKALSIALLSLSIFLLAGNLDKECKECK